MRKPILVALALLTSFAAAEASAQVPGINLNLFPRVGMYTPGSELGDLEGRTLKLGGGLAFGLSAELVLPVLPDIRANLEYASGLKLKSSGTEGEDEENTVLALTADLALNLSPPLSPVKPYLLIGGGIKRYELTSFSLRDDEHSDPTIHLGAGVGVKVGPLHLVGEASDYVSWFKGEGADSSKIQNDIFIMVGFKIGMF